jgi:hypothetical protein
MDGIEFGIVVMLNLNGKRRVIDPPSFLIWLVPDSFIISNLEKVSDTNATVVHVGVVCDT